MAIMAHCDGGHGRHGLCDHGRGGMTVATPAMAVAIMTVGCGSDCGHESGVRSQESGAHAMHKLYV